MRNSLDVQQLRMIDDVIELAISGGASSECLRL
jgi:hypothetical protein